MYFQSSKGTLSDSLHMRSCRPLLPIGLRSLVLQVRYHDQLPMNDAVSHSIPLYNLTMPIDYDYIISIIPTRPGTMAGNHCCYRRGDLCTDSECGGTVDKVTPQDWATYLQHTMEDVLPAVFCCKGTFPNCSSYQQKRPIDDGSKSPPTPPVPGV